MTIFGRDCKEPKFVEELKLKWCKNFKLLGVYFDATLSEMQKNYQIGLESIRKELHSWKFRHLTVFGKLTVIKTLCLPKLTHIVTVVPNPCSTFITELESEFNHFISDNNPSVVNEVTRHMQKKVGGPWDAKRYFFLESNTYVMA